LGDFKCYICEIPTKHDSDVQLIEHMTCHKGMLPYKCPKCDNWPTIKELRKLNNHLKMHAQPIKCDFCDKRYSCRKTVNEHVRLVHSEKPEPVKCPKCDKLCSDQAKLNKHMVLHTDKFKCEICGKTFVTIAMLKRHQLQHKSSEERDVLVCFICGNNYMTKDTLELHLASHNQIRHHKCEICEERFMRLSDLNRHLKLHESEKYTRKRNWKEYYTIEIDEDTQEKRYICYQCGSISSNASTIRSHILTHVRPYTCSYCDERFNDRAAQLDHENKHTGAKPRKCRYCDKTFAHTSTLYFHHKTHPEFSLERTAAKKT
jgi:uncharacterized Zn-finger protein